MSRGNKWVPLDKYLAQDLNLIRGRPFTRIEAMLSYTIDQDKGKKGTIAGYSVQWSWSRNKVRRFINCIRTDSGHVRDSKRTHEGHPIHFIDTALMGKKDTTGTDRGQIEDRLHDTTIKPNPNPKPKIKDILQNTTFAGQPEQEPEFYLTYKKRKISGKHLETFLLFWDAFGDKRSKATATDSWLEIPSLTDALVLKIVEAAKIYSANRQDLKDEGTTPKMAQGWLSSRRWEDEQVKEETSEEYAIRRGLN